MADVKYTTGGFLYDSFGREFKGFYFQSDDKKFYYGRDPRNKSVRLFTEEDIKYKIYKLNKKINNIESERPSYYKPNLEDIDYMDGFFYRYVCQHKINRDIIIEISRQSYEKYGSKSGINKSLWNVASIKWYVIGELSYIITQNENELKKISHAFPGIKSYFNNLSEYAENNIE